MLFLKNNNISFFYKVKEEINALSSSLNKRMLRNVYTYLIHFCTYMVRKGKTNFIKELLDIYKIMLEKKIYVLQREISYRFYKGAVDSALKLKEYDWAVEFIEKYKRELPENIRENTYYHCTALYEFALKNYETALEMLRKVKYTQVYQKLDLRCLIAELYYELNLDSLLLSHIDSFRHFLSNDKIIPLDRKRYYSNFIKYVKCLSGLKYKEKKQDLKYLKQKAVNNTTLYNKEWVLEKIDLFNN